MELLPVFLILCMATSGMSIRTNSLLGSSSFNVMSYGADGDGKTDDSEAFMKAWSAACDSQSSEAHLIIPSKTFLLKPVKFSGPCKASRITVQVSGKIVASTDKSAFKGNYWLLFHSVEGLTLWGGGSIDGKGSVWWQDKDGYRPPALKFYECPGMVLKRLTHLNSQKQHIVITKCDGALISNIKVIAPEDSPNTDGINIASSKDVRVQRSIISTGDDCIAISAGSSDIKIRGMKCGPSHGISIGALGDPGKPDESVKNVIIRDCILKGKHGIGIRIKTWQGGLGHVKNIAYKNIEVDEVGTPIVIDQFYCPRGACKNNSDALRVSDVLYSGIRGTYTGENAMSLLCSQNVACTNVVLENINLRSVDPEKAAQAECFNVKGRSENVKPVVDCLSQQFD